MTRFFTGEVSVPEGIVRQPEKRKHNEELVRALANLGIDAAKIEGQVMDRFALLDERTPVLEDEMRMLGYADELFAYSERNNTENTLTPDEKIVVKLAALFADIGKTGPANATEHKKL